MLLGFKNRGLAGNPGSAPRSLNPELSVVGSRGRVRASARQQAARGAVRARPLLAPGPAEAAHWVRIPAIPPLEGDNEVMLNGCVERLGFRESGAGKRSVGLRRRVAGPESARRGVLLQR